MGAATPRAAGHRAAVAVVTVLMVPLVPPGIKRAARRPPAWVALAAVRAAVAALAVAGPAGRTEAGPRKEEGRRVVSVVPRPAVIDGVIAAAGGAYRAVGAADAAALSGANACTRVAAPDGPPTIVAGVVPAIAPTRASSRAVTVVVAVRAAARLAVAPAGVTPGTDAFRCHLIAAPLAKQLAAAGRPRVVTPRRRGRVDPAGPAASGVGPVTIRAPPPRAARGRIRGPGGGIALPLTCAAPRNAPAKVSVVTGAAGAKAKA